MRRLLTRKFIFKSAVPQLSTWPVWDDQSEVCVLASLPEIPLKWQCWGEERNKSAAVKKLGRKVFVDERLPHISCVWKQTEMREWMMESRGSQTPKLSLGPSAERLPVTLPGCTECLEEGDRSPFHAGCYFRKTEENNRRLFRKGNEPAEQGSCLDFSECRPPCSAFFRDEAERPTLGWS